MKVVVTICIWHNRFASELYLGPDGKMMEFRDYGKAWEYIFAHNLPAGASAVEIIMGGNS